MEEADYADESVLDGFESLLRAATNALEKDEESFTIIFRSGRKDENQSYRWPMVSYDSGLVSKIV
ncbi:hypothetical protein J6590_085842 [Homalodisca vitripennis]|nr:hypothetical protein J6590_085842 [Homalodisca vitripennis]